MNIIVILYKSIRESIFYVLYELFINKLDRFYGEQIKSYFIEDCLKSISLGLLEIKLLILFISELILSK